MQPAITKVSIKCGSEINLTRQENVELCQIKFNQDLRFKYELMEMERLDFEKIKLKAVDYNFSIQRSRKLKSVFEFECKRMN